MPRWKIEINNIDHRNANGIKRGMVIGNIAIEVIEMLAHCKRVSCGEEAAGQLRRRFRRQRHCQRFITYHVKKHSAAEPLLLFGITQLASKMPTAVKTVRVRKTLERFFTIEKDELSLRRLGRLRSQHPPHFNEQAGTRPAIVGTDKRDGIECLGIIMRAK